MAKKHGFRGTPVKPSLTLSSVAGIFERRGDPMITAREGREKFGRNLDTENPDYDQFFASRAVLKPGQVDRGNAFRKLARGPQNVDPQQRAANIGQKYAKIRKARTVDVSERPPDRVKPEIKINRGIGKPRDYALVNCENCRVAYDRMRWDSCPCCNPIRRK